ncbi:plasmid related protein [Burkholderia pseudomallei]|uniref:hypothetical protein n=1 Tax=Burkholderia pseudomallei TaxID=28450 RepID=UPI0009789F4C|nr:hypothetical protein [Burkholderia pseudomallei]MBF3568999.1 hypothetical protein [Burkholderia pseudomallei]OMS41610.1 hypothetical protein AQ742_07950 [Burkholderia pseudomallei]CAJ3342304.1 plasmid related protein [Burkholderia pseudomallei]CAJ4247338.1 plasmid related protein [Burkholderia pseudomallei]CAJ6836985.1 plasmid related protein [Burkholderia pseudomallei]
MNLPMPQRAGPRFKIGRVFATPAAVDALDRTGTSILDLLIRHMRGDWGNLSESDKQQNELALISGGRLLSSYSIAEARIWIVTEADRSATTLLLPDEY